MKYVITKKEEVYILDDSMRHDYMFTNPDEVLSAGFFREDENGAHCYGYSITLNKDSRGEEDNLLVSRAIKDGRYVLWKRGDPKIKAFILVPEDPKDYA